MRKLLATLATLMLVAFAFAAPAGAQDDPVIGTVTTDPPVVPEAGEYDVTASGSGYIPDTTILVGACRAPGDALVFGVSTTEEITATLTAINPIVDCDVTGASSVDVDADGNWTLTKTVTINDNFAFSAGALDGSQQGAIWIPIGDPAALAVTGVDSWGLAMIGLGLLAVGAVAVMGSRRFELV